MLSVLDYEVNCGTSDASKMGREFLDTLYAIMPPIYFQIWGV